MSHRTMRDFLGALEKKGLLRRITRPVDRMWEPAALVKWMFQALPDERRFGMLFEKVKGSDIPLAIGALGASTAAYATALGVEPQGINEAWAAAYRQPVPPRRLDKGLCQEVVITGKELRLSYLPIPVWTPGKDKCPYVTTNTLTSHRDTGIQNMGVYRTMVRDETSLIVNVTPAHHGYHCVASWTDKGQVAPIAWVIAGPPAVHYAGVANVPFGFDEFALAGGMLGEPVNMVKCRTHDLLVPADAEIIIEGEIRPGETDVEGPFGEMAGYVGPPSRRPVVHVTAITHRRNPIYYGYSSQMPPSESTVIQSLTNAGLILKTLRYDLGEHTVSDVFIDLTYGGTLGHAIVAMKPGYTAHARKVGRLVADMSTVKRVTVVDDDVDIRDHSHVDWAMNARYSPARDTIVMEDVFVPVTLDPSLRSNLSQSTMGSKIVFDATLKTDLGTFSLPTREIMMQALEVWKEAGLPEFDIPRRAKLRIDQS